MPKPSATASTCLGLALVLVLAACSGDPDAGSAADSQPPETSATTLPTGVNTAAFEAVFADAMGSRGRTFAVTYDFYAPDLVGGDTGALTLAQELPQRATRFVADGDARGVAFVGADPDVVACGLSQAQWHCYQAQGYFESAPAVLDYGDLLGVFDTFRANQRWFTWSSDVRSIAGQPARCAVAAATAADSMDAELQRRVGTSATLCVAPDGVPLLVEASRAEGAEILFRAAATSYATQVGSEAFEPPATVEAGPPNVTIPMPRPPGDEPEGQVN